MHTDTTDATRYFKPSGEEKSMARILSIDANPYVVRLAVVEPDGSLHAGIDVKPTNTDRLLMFIRSQAITTCHYITVVGSPQDRWPNELHGIVEQEVGCDVNWISPIFLGRSSFQLSHWQQQRKFDRARLLALAAASQDKQTTDADSIVRQWQEMLIEEVHQRLADKTPMA
jgi:hypothetical protein